jgi:hypothetical protein
MCSSCPPFNTKTLTAILVSAAWARQRHVRKVFFKHSHSHTHTRYMQPSRCVCECSLSLWGDNTAVVQVLVRCGKQEAERTREREREKETLFVCFQLEKNMISLFLSPFFRSSVRRFNYEPKTKRTVGPPTHAVVLPA